MYVLSFIHTYIEHHTETHGRSRKPSLLYMYAFVWKCTTVIIAIFAALTELAETLVHLFRDLARLIVDLLDIPFLDVDLAKFGNYVLFLNAFCSLDLGHKSNVLYDAFSFFAGWMVYQRNLNLRSWISGCKASQIRSRSRGCSAFSPRSYRIRK